MSGLIAVSTFLLSLFFNLALFVLWIRIALRYLRLGSLTTFGRLITTLTNPLITPLSKLMHYKGLAKQRYDWPAVMVLICIEFIKVFLLSALILKTPLPFLWSCIFVMADLIIQPCNLLFYALLIRMVMSFVNPYWQHPFADFLKALTNPLLIVGKKIIPDISGFDFSPWIIMIILKIITLFIHASLPISML
ncbi:MAG: YggT family protein [Legionella sp.]|nr:MAG: YggT family protein [Legionella sp.]PJD99627.1 MAG: YggT family protein [Legionella sp.]